MSGNKKIKLIIFDAYGVALTGGYVDTCKLLAKRFNKNWEDIYDVIYRKWFNQAAERKITQKEAWVEAVNELNLLIKWKDVRAAHYSLMGVNKKILAFSENQKGKVKTVLLSKNTRSQFSDVSQRLEFKNNFDYVLNTWELNLPKASRKTILYIIKKFEVKPEEIVYLDDQKENLCEAEKLGVHTIYYKNNKQLKNILKIINQ